MNLIIDNTIKEELINELSIYPSYAILFFKAVDEDNYAQNFVLLDEVPIRNERVNISLINSLTKRCSSLGYACYVLVLNTKVTHEQICSYAKQMQLSVEPKHIKIGIATIKNNNISVYL